VDIAAADTARADANQDVLIPELGLGDFGDFQMLVFGEK
jgi:hypothetical protein